MGYVAQKVFKVDGRRVMPGEPLPGAEEWKHLHSLLSLGYVAGYPDPKPAETKPKRGNGRKKADADPADGGDSGELDVQQQPVNESQGQAQV